MPYRLCRNPPCQNVTDQTYCGKCNPPKKKENRPDATKRGYDHRWKAFRRSYLSKHPLCVDCKERGVIATATDVHHIQKMTEAPHLKYVASNLMALCKRCHSIRTARGE